MIRRFHIDITPNASDPQQQLHRYNIAQELWKMIDGYITTDIDTGMYNQIDGVA